LVHQLPGVPSLLMTDRKRDIIQRNVAESRRLGREADRDAEKAINGLRRAARSGRYRSADSATGRYVAKRSAA
jgi:hypothetical protein